MASKITYKIFTYKTSKPTIYVQIGKDILRFSDDREGDEWENEWAKQAVAGGWSFDDIATGNSYFDTSQGNYQEDKEKVNRMIEALGYDAPK